MCRLVAQWGRPSSQWSLKEMARRSTSPRFGTKPNNSTIHVGLSSSAVHLWSPGLLWYVCFVLLVWPLSFQWFQAWLQIHSHTIVDLSAHRWTHLLKAAAVDQEFKQSSPFPSLMLTPPLLHNHNIRQYTSKHFVQPILLFQPYKKYQKRSKPL